MIIVNFGTSEHFENNVGDKYYCKSKRSAEQWLKQFVLLRNYGNKRVDDIMKQFKAIYIDDSVNIESKGIEIIDDLYIQVEEVHLID